MLSAQHAGSPDRPLHPRLRNRCRIQRQKVQSQRAERSAANPVFWTDVTQRLRLWTLGSSGYMQELKPVRTPTQRGGAPEHCAWLRSYLKLTDDQETVISLEDVTTGRWPMPQSHGHAHKDNNWTQGSLTLKREHVVGRGACYREGRVGAGGVIKTLVYTYEIFKE